MVNDQLNKRYFFIDESGDPNFYAKRKKLLVGTAGYQPLLFIGMIATEQRKFLRKSILALKKEIENDPFYNTLHSVKPGWFFHAIEDHPDIKAKFINHIRNLENFKTYIVIGRKDLHRFQTSHNSKPSEFYFDLLYHLVKDRLNSREYQYQIFLAKRQETKMAHFSQAVARAIERDNARRSVSIDISYQCDIVLSSNYPEMSIIDYLLWALQRYIRFDEKRYYNTLVNKYNLIIDLYDTANYTTKGGGKNNYYSRKNTFDKDKASDFGF